jgi:hypothetical protein
MTLQFNGNTLLMTFNKSRDNTFVGKPWLKIRFLTSRQNTLIGRLQIKTTTDSRTKAIIRFYTVWHTFRWRSRGIKSHRLVVGGRWPGGYGWFRDGAMSRQRRSYLPNGYLGLDSLLPPRFGYRNAMMSILNKVYLAYLN